MDNLDSKLNNQVGILICGHGSRNKLAITEFQELTKLIQKRYPNILVEYGFLEFAKPSLVDALEKLRDHSIKTVIAIPAMLFAAGHVKNDIPSLLMNYSSKTEIEIIYGRELGINNLMISAACERVKDVFKQNNSLKPEESLLVVVGRGSSDPDANSNVSKITRMIVEGIGLGWGETVFSGVTFPLVEAGLKNVVRLGYKNIIIFPYFLFSGVLVTRIKRQSDLVAINNPHISFNHAKYLSSQTYVVDTFVERIEEILNNEGKNFMNCSTCKYRSNLFGFEKEVGLLQESHHDHVEGLGISCDLCDPECNGACETQNQTSTHDHVESNLVADDYLEHKHNECHQHNENHHHHQSIYPNSKHPLGPVTLRLLNKDQILRKSIENN
ncbi:sirohydrochlorin chelatase [Prochlorococcus marinus]|uniref:sirohydrochlorin chelatase n=1 Tax=Prochlorococcus marinus TaxID=1219 RepID=UPI001FD80B68|nr:sirohydrochlorin chelatase [Prochlorococcus marinus]